MTDDSIRIYPVEPGGNIQLESLPPEAKDAAMGRYMAAFSRLETMIHLATGAILGIERSKLNSIFVTLMTKQSIDLLDAVGQEWLTSKGAARVSKLCERLKNRNMRRNHIVHGSWQQVVVAHDDHATQQWVRTYHHINPSLRKLDHDDPKLLGMYTFTVPVLDKATDHVQEMSEAISALMADLPSLRPPPQPPEESQEG